MVVRRHLPALGVVVTVPSIIVAQLVACGGGSHANIDSHITLHDSPNGSADAADLCTATASYGAATLGGSAVSQYAGSGSSQATGFFEFYLDSLNTGATPDYLEVDLYSGYGAFTGVVKPGSYTLGNAATGDNVNSTCGVCVIIDTDVNTSTGAVTDFYFANAGTLTLTADNETSFAGTLSNAMFTHVTAGSDSMGNPIAGDTAAADGCTSSITSATMTATPTMQPANFRGGDTVDGIPVHIHLRNRY